MLLALFAANSSQLHALSYEEWVQGFDFGALDDTPMGNADNDPYSNGLEFVFGTDPLAPTSAVEVGPWVEPTEGGSAFIFQIYNDLDAEVKVVLERATGLSPNDWNVIAREDSGRPDPLNPDITFFEELIPSGEPRYFYRLSFTIPFSNDREAKISVGNMVGLGWDGITQIDTAYIYQDNPAVLGTDPAVEDDSKYPRAIGATQTAFTENLLKDFQGERPRLRSWMGWFLWGNGTPPPGRKAGFDFNWDSTVKDPWDYFSYQQTLDDNNELISASWTPVRVDQQPLYMHPLRLNYNWAPGRFGFETKPLLHFPNNVFYYKEKTIVRGINLSPNYPYFIQYGDKIDTNEQPNYPEAWAERWLRMKNRPLETLVLVPSVIPPADINNNGEYLLANGAWNDVETGSATNYQPFPYPVFNTDLPPQDQTPFTVLTDKMGDWHADLVYEGGHPGLSNYNPVRYFRTNYDQMADGNYLKMTVAQGSPFVWCEYGASVTGPQDNDRYMIFYNLIRQNLKGSVDNNSGTGAETVTQIDGMAGPWEVPGVDGVSYVLLYGNQNNPNQFYQEVEADFKKLIDPDAPLPGMDPGGFNQPGDQNNQSYFAVFYRTDSVEAVTLGNGGVDSADNNGTDAQGNPYFFLKFDTSDPTYQKTGKGWFVVGQVPVMRYYHTDVPRDDRSLWDNAAKAWADEMGKYAFNFLTDTRIDYSVQNMNKVTTEFHATFGNPYEAAGAVGGASMTAAADKTVWALFPHHYQPLTLGPDLTKASQDQVVWNPLKTTGIDFPSVTSPPNANKSTPTTEARWDYWHPRGTLKSVVTGSFTVEYPFQNFLPAMPPPKWEQNYEQIGVQYITLDNVDSYTMITEEPTATLVDKRIVGVTPDAYGNPITQLGSGATFKVLREPQTGQILQVDVVTRGTGYPEGNPPPADQLELVISAPPLSNDPNDQATARVQVNGVGQVLAVFMNNKGDGYRSTVKVTQAGNENLDPALVLPRFEDPDHNNPDAPRKMLSGQARILSGGAGYDFDDTVNPVVATVIGNGSGGTATIAAPGQVFGIRNAAIGGFDANGRYPVIGDDPDPAVNLQLTAANIVAELPSPVEPSKNAPTLVPQLALNKADPFLPLVTDGGLYSALPTASYLDDASQSHNLIVESRLVDGGTQITKLNFDGPIGEVSTARPVSFTGGTAISEASAQILPSASLSGLILQSDPNTGTYDTPVEVAFAGGQAGAGSDTGTFEMPTFDWSVDAQGKLVVTDFAPDGKGKGFWADALFEVRGGRGFDAAFQVFVEPTSGVSGEGVPLGKISEVKVARRGSNYPKEPGAVGALIRQGDPVLTQSALLEVIVGDDGGIDSVNVINGGDGYLSNNSRTVELVGIGIGATFDVTVVGGEITDVAVTDGGSGYSIHPNTLQGIATGAGAGALFGVNVNSGTGVIESVVVQNGGSGYLDDDSTQILIIPGPDAAGVVNPPRGAFASIDLKFNTATGELEPRNPGIFVRNSAVQRGYLPNSNGTTSNLTPRLNLYFQGVNTRQVLQPSLAAGFLTQSVPKNINVEQVMYDNVIGQYKVDMSDGQRPFGGAFGGNSAPDGYGLGNQLSATTKWVNVLYHLQQQYEDADVPSVTPSPWAFVVGSTPYAASEPYTYERGIPILADHNPLFTLTGALETSVQMMQRTLSLLHVDVNGRPYTNEVTDQSLTWTMEYFSSYDYGVGRIVINPTATIPANGIVSSVSTPPPPPADQNDPKSGLLSWQEGRLWSGFGVSDQWNDQHYFFGYYLGVAGWAAIFDHSWDKTIDAKPTGLWASSSQMGTALDQWYLSVAYDPDNAALVNDIYTKPEFTYQKLPFFDQWTGHGWATGAQPGPAGSDLQDSSNWSKAQGSGTSNFKYGDENENSVWEGLQAFSAAILWGAGTDRKSLTDVGVYMLATGMAANDMYFADKNYNLSESARNEYSWVPVTTTPASEVANNGGNTYPQNVSFVSANPSAYYDAPEYFGGEASTGVSLIRKYGPELENFFYAFPTGSKFITAYPPTAWTLGIARNTDYMRRFTGAMMQEDWAAARNSDLYQAGNWLGMALTSALSGVPYNPGDLPLNAEGTELKPVQTRPREYVERLWSSWTSLNDIAGIQAARQPAFSSTSAMHFLHATDAYGTPDWTYIGRATNAGGADDNNAILFQAVFTKLSDDGSTVETTFVAFNPGWETRYSVFDRLASDGSVGSISVSGVMEVKPKKMVVKTMIIPVN
ncbi:hypothetical protein [Cerasicoccus arenae]|uniref:Uncharacterized protein n=1 Tax=Cerasicoccus arenae TaxID=424488 RepID=A0A8J3GDD4_9BACT|nr:hypothetical protein [Cerasicoccus arenae]MBK1859973.1 hypothetical protein [Cerasicoccus arenae]GHB95792.1 hypothetical protein GCM10007047_09580 [Cerasicoccus arenae]